VLLFSATFPERVVRFSEAVAPKAIWIKVKTEELSLDNIHQFYMKAKDEANKFEILVNLYSIMDVGQSIIFVHTVKTAKYLAKKMRDMSMVVALLHGKDMEHTERDR
jgi:ATP-dependent RNA helicase DDX19/DBP5